MFSHYVVWKFCEILLKCYDTTLCIDILIYSSIVKRKSLKFYGFYSILGFWTKHLKKETIQKSKMTYCVKYHEVEAKRHINIEVTHEITCFLRVLDVSYLTIRKCSHKTVNKWITNTPRSNLLGKCFEIDEQLKLETFLFKKKEQMTTSITFLKFSLEKLKKFPFGDIITEGRISSISLSISNRFSLKN